MTTHESLAERCDLEGLLARFPDLAVRPSKSHVLRLVGALPFDADGGRGLPRIADAFDVELLVTHEFPLAVPVAFERGGRIASSYHRNGGGDLCLGAPLTLRLILRRHPTLRGFVERILVPYFYRWAHIQQYGSEPWPELPHFDPGLVQEFSHLFATDRPEVMSALADLSRLKRRVANKHVCPCGSNRRLGRCHNRQVNYYRQIQRDLRSDIQAARVRLSSKQSPSAK